MNDREKAEAIAELPHIPFRVTKILDFHADGLAEGAKMRAEDLGKIAEASGYFSASKDGQLPSLVDHIASLKASADGAGKLLRLDQPWSLPEIVGRLVEAGGHLLEEHGCDLHGHEEVRAAVEAGKEWLKTWSPDLKEAP